MMTAATMLFASSCSKEQISTTVPVGEEVTVTLTADLGAIESRAAIADGKKVNEVAWAIYLHGSTTPLPDFQGVLPINGKEGKLDVRLVTGRSYDIAMFAYYTENPTDKQVNDATDTPPAPKYYQIDWSNNLVAVQYPNGPIANDDDARDCFWFVRENLEVNAPINETFELHRPLAQLNFGVTAQDTADAEAAGLVVSQSKIVAYTYTQFNVLTGKCTGELVEYTFAQNVVPSQALTVGDVDYTYIGTAYLLVNDGEPLKDNVSITIYDEDNNTTAVNTLSYDNVPFKRNYRTNILGALLTNPAEFTIKVDERFVDQNGNPTKDYIVKHWDGTSKAVAEVNGTYTVTEPAELAWIAEQVNSGENSFEGKAVVLSVDEDEVIDLNCLNNYLWTPIGTAENPFKGSFDGNGVIIRNMKVVATECAGLFGSVVSGEGIKNVILEDAVIESSHYAGAVAGYAYADITGCTVNGLTMNVLPNDTTTRTATYDNGDKAGGIVGYVGEGGYKINGNTVEEATIIAYRDLGGIAGAAYIGECTGNIVKKSTLKVDQTVNGYGEEIANLDEVVGRVLGGTVGENTVVEVELVWNPETLKPATPISNITAKGNYIVKGIVSAVGTSAYFITDGTGALMVYGSKHNRVLGECVRIEGEVSRYNGYNTNAWQIKSTSTLVISEGNTLKYNPTVLTAADIDALVGQTATSTEVELVGNAYLSDKGYINIDIEGGNKDASLYYVAVDDYKHLVGSNVTVKGYITGTYQYLNVLPYEVTDNKKATEWGIVGDMTGWAKGKDIPMYTYDNKVMFAKGVEVTKGQGFKIRANNEWNDKKNYGVGVDGKDKVGVYTNMPIPVYTDGGSSNIYPAATGTYDIYFDLTNKKVYVMEADKSIDDAVEYKEYVKRLDEENTWGVVGSFNNWDVANSVTMTIEGDYAVAKNVTLTKNAEFKFAADKAWTLSYGSGCDVNVDKKYTAYNNGGNMKFVGENGAYNIYFSMVNATFYMEKYVEAEPVETVEAKITFDNKNKITSISNDQMVWVENNITVTNDKNKSSNAVKDYAKPARFYQGSKVTVAVTGEITQIVFDCNSSAYAADLKSSIKSGATVTVASDKVTAILTTPASSFVVDQLVKQVRMDAITVTYNK